MLVALSNYHLVLDAVERLGEETREVHGDDIPVFLARKLKLEAATRSSRIHLRLHLYDTHNELCHSIRSIANSRSTGVANMSFLGFGGRPQPSSAEKIAAAEAEIEMVGNMFNQ